LARQVAELDIAHTLGAASGAIKVRFPSRKLPVGTNIHAGGSTIGEELMIVELFPLVANPFAETCGKVPALAILAPALAAS